MVKISKFTYNVRKGPLFKTLEININIVADLKFRTF